MQTLVDVARESFLILDADLLIISGNPIFYQTFQVAEEQTENKFVYELGNGQWNIPQLRACSKSSPYDILVGYEKNLPKRYYSLTV